MNLTSLVLLVLAVFWIAVGVVSCSEAVKPRPPAAMEMHK